MRNGAYLDVVEGLRLWRIWEWKVEWGVQMGGTKKYEKLMECFIELLKKPVTTEVYLRMTMNGMMR
ncbi:hypothetical protein RJ639_040685 [Escallonia herrerae]|uniref:Uncharacterized protein n=1 Tax=Escallonia herrerae TaxID=1293975 RepID=A0AA88WGH3_9ASTE|nr:hypothetical protein RJ639_040685 [Escallonia herrerae]